MEARAAVRDLFTTISTADFSGATLPDARSLENPMFSLQDPSTFEAMGIGMPSSAGIRVDRRTAMTLDTWYRAVDLVSDYVSRCPLKVRKWISADNSMPDVKHPAYRLLFQAARMDTGEKGTEFLGAAVLEKDDAGPRQQSRQRLQLHRPRSAHRPPPPAYSPGTDRTYPIRVNGRKYYVSHVAQDYIGGSDGRPDGGGQTAHETMVILRPEDVFHLKGLGYDCMMGYITFDMGAETLGQALATRQYGSKYFANNAEPRVVVEMPVGQIWTIPERQEFVREFNTMHSSVNNAAPHGDLDQRRKNLALPDQRRTGPACG